ALGGAFYTVSYRYDAAGNLTGIRYPGSETWVEYAYDGANRLKSVAGFTTDDGFTYDPSGIPLATRYTNGTSTTYRLDHLGRIELLETVSPTESLLKLVYGYDPVGNIVSIARDGKKDERFAYNRADELVEESISGFELPAPLAAAVNKTTLGPGETLQVTLNWRGNPVAGDYRVVLRLVGTNSATGLVLAEDIHFPEEAGAPPISTWNGEITYIRTLTIPAESAYRGPAVLTIALADPEDPKKVYSLNGAGEWGSGHYVVFEGLTVGGSSAVRERELMAGDLTGERLESMGPVIVPGVGYLYRNNERVTTTSTSPGVLIKSFSFTNTEDFTYHALEFNVDVEGIIEFPYIIRGNLAIYLDGQLIKTCLSESSEKTIHRFVHELGDLSLGEHRVEFWLYKQDIFFPSQDLEAANTLCEVRPYRWRERGREYTLEPEVIYRDTSTKTITGTNREVSLGKTNFLLVGSRPRKLQFHLNVKGDHHVVLLVFHYWTAGHLQVYLDGRLLRSCRGDSEAYTYYTFEEDVSDLPDGIHTVEFKLSQSGNEQDLFGDYLTASSTIREVRLIQGDSAPFTWTSREVWTVKPIKEVVLQTNAYTLGSRVSLSTDGGGNWVPIKSTDLGRALPLEDNPRRVMLRIENIPRSPAGDYEYRLQAFPGSEAPPVSGTSALNAAYGYDHVGNRVRETINGKAAVYEYHPHSDRLWKKGDITFSYDPNGNLVLKETPDGRWNYQYDYANRLTAVYKDGVLRKQYLYDHAGLRIGAVDAEGRSTIYLYDLAGNLIQERAGEEVRNYIWALGKHLARVDGVIGEPASQIYWYHTDHLGTVQVLSDAHGQVVWRNDYRAFGEQMGPEVEEIENAHAFTGKDWDEDIGLYYFNARWYDPELGRFISQDTYLGTLDEPQTLNLYTYCYNNPLINTDPTGHDVGFTQNPVCNPDYQQRLIDLHNEGYSWEEVDKVVKAETTIPGFKFDPWKAKSSCTPLNLENQIQLYLILQVQRAEFLKDEKLSLIEKAKLWLLKQQLTLAFNWLNIQTGIYNLLHRNDRGYFYTSEQIESALYDIAFFETLALAGAIQYAIDSRQLQVFSSTTANSANGPRYIYDAKIGRYRDVLTGRFVAQRDLPYPSNQGFEYYSTGTLELGKIIDRFGALSGRYAGEPGASISARGMPPGSEALPYTKLEVIKPIDNVKIGPTAGVPEFAASGGAIQYYLPNSIDYLINNGYLRVIK
ncbi:MAG: glycohydrolase toxin TNT-related protein, partial [Firmicutes bacterium]|nr:glycohydrolase toxin TNT-related protein [Bacillota bacterium]